MYLVHAGQTNTKLVFSCSFKNVISLLYVKLWLCLWNWHCYFWKLDGNMGYNMGEIGEGKRGCNGEEEKRKAGKRRLYQVWSTVVTDIAAIDCVRASPRRELVLTCLHIWLKSNLEKANNLKVIFLCRVLFLNLNFSYMQIYVNAFICPPKLLL